MEAVLSRIFVYPVKSARGIELERATLSDRGLMHDRRFMVVDDHGHMLTQRVVGGLARLSVAIDGEELALDFEGRRWCVPLAPDGGEPRTVRVFADQVTAIDLGRGVQTFLSEALGRSAALVYMPDDTQRQVDRKYASKGDIVGFADGFPFLLASESSLEALNRVLATPIGIERFRPNFVVRGLPAYAEDTLRELHIGDVPFVGAKPSSRCVIVNTDQRTGEREKGVFEKLTRVHAVDRKPMFGLNLLARGSGHVAVGDRIVTR